MTLELTNLYLTILNKVKDSIIVISGNGSVLFYNKVAEGLLGLDKNLQKLDWLNNFDLLKADGKFKIERKNHPISRILRDERVIEEEFVIAIKNKIPKSVVITSHTIINNGTKDGYLIVVQDISQQKETEKKLNSRSKSLIEAYEGLRRAEAGLKTTNIDLEKRVLERTQHLIRMNKELQKEIQIRLKAEKQIKESNSELRKINSDLDNFIYTASHDLKAPISNIEGLINVLKEENCYSNESTKELIDLICQSVEKFKSTISDLTEISKVQKGGMEIIEEVNFNEIFSEVRESIFDLINSSRAIIETNFKCSSIHFSKKNLRSIFYNLLTNSIKYTDMSRIPHIKISTEFEKKYCILKISDNGLGIPEEKINQIFSMFKRLHDHVEGSGIGLYIVKRIIENAEGKIEVVSKLGRGTEFKIYFLRENTTAVH